MGLHRLILSPTKAKHSTAGSSRRDSCLLSLGLPTPTVASGSACTLGKAKGATEEGGIDVLCCASPRCALLIGRAFLFGQCPMARSAIISQCADAIDFRGGSSLSRNISRAGEKTTGFLDTTLPRLSPCQSFARTRRSLAANCLLSVGV